MNPRRAEPAARGFTLLEVLVALVLLAVALLALVRVAGMSTASFDGARERALAGWVADNALAELRLEPALPETGRREGRARMASRSWQWRLVVAPTEVPGIRRVDVDVWPAVEGRDGVAPLYTLHGFVDDRLQR